MKQITKNKLKTTQVNKQNYLPNECKMKLFLIFLFAPILSFSQDFNNSHREWTSGKISWDDFYEVDEPFGTQYSEMSYYINYRTEYLTSDSAVYETFISNALMSKSGSWVYKNGKTDDLLKYNQICFDLVEIYSRKLQNGLRKIQTSSYLLQSVAYDSLAEINAQLQSEMRTFQKSTEFGSNKKVVSSWEEKVRKSLSDIPREIIPSYKLDNSGFGGSFDIPLSLLFGSMGNKFTNSLGIGYGIEYLRNEWIYYLRANLVFNSVKQTFINGNNVWEKDLSTSQAIIELSAGYPFYTSGKNNLLIFAGLNLLEFGTTKNEDRYKDYAFYSYGPVIGLNYDIPFKKRVNLLSSNFSRTEDNYFYRFRLWMTYFNSGSNVSGLNIYFSIGIGGLGTFIE